MSASFGLPLVLDASKMIVLVVGGGAVATRKIFSLLDSGALVRVRAPRVADALQEREAADEHLLIEHDFYDEAAIGDATLVLAATDDHALNLRIAADARRAHRLVLVAGDPAAGTCVMPAVHRSGDLLVAVTSGGVPRASARVRDDLARRLDDRYAAAIRDLARLRQRLLEDDDRSAWRSAASALLADDFCESVESGEFSERLAEWQ
ncbi:MAG TPA: bifunctional precorrin-2 dehydrogenase/sirohydrochlorin ferrochelatase [Gemmatimonadaceae bacterium]|jgi:siroheme synthase-like protein